MNSACKGRAHGRTEIRFQAGQGLYSRSLCLQFCVSSSLACRPPPTVRRPAPTGFMRLSTTAIALWRGEIPSAAAFTRRGNDWSHRFPLAVNHLKVRSCLIDGEVVCCDEKE